MAEIWRDYTIILFAPSLWQVVRDCHDHGLYIFSWGEISKSSTQYRQTSRMLNVSYAACQCGLVSNQLHPGRAVYNKTLFTSRSFLIADNDPTMYNRQKAAAVDAIILDDVAKITKVALPAPLRVSADTLAHHRVITSWHQWSSNKARLSPDFLLTHVLHSLQASGKEASFFNKSLRSPPSFDDVEVVNALERGVAPLAIGSPPADSLEQA